MRFAFVHASAFFLYLWYHICAYKAMELDLTTHEGIALVLMSLIPTCVLFTADNNDNNKGYFQTAILQNSKRFTGS